MKPIQIDNLAELPHANMLEFSIDDDISTAHALASYQYKDRLFLVVAWICPTPHCWQVVEKENNLCRKCLPF